MDVITGLGSLWSISKLFVRVMSCSVLSEVDQMTSGYNIVYSRMEETSVSQLSDVF